ncbi:MAG: hypothetical protein ACKOFI_12630, partial [Phycisphaerales bacterium]
MATESVAFAEPPDPTVASKSSPVKLRSDEPLIPSDLLREKLKELQRERPDDPRLQGLIEKMLQEADA